MANVEEVRIGDARALVVLPEADRPHPGVLMVHEIFGINDDIRRKASKFADHGYAVVAPDLLSTGVKAVCIARMLREFAQWNMQGSVGATLDASRAHLEALDSVDARRIGVVGFCIGGAFALGYGLRPGIRATAVNYGKPPKQMSDLEGVCPVVGSYGARDPELKGAGPKLDVWLTELGVDHDVKTYPDAGHAFLNDGPVPMLLAPLTKAMHATHVPDAAEDTWARIFNFFNAHLA